MPGMLGVRKLQSVNSVRIFLVKSRMNRPNTNGIYHPGVMDEKVR